MAISNKFGHLVLATGNKSEMSVGYSTLYGDMAGGFAVIKDVPKTMVYGLARFRNELGPSPVIPKRILDRPPTAELRPNQKDEDSLPPYAVLDPILRAYIEEDRSLDEIVEAGFDRATVSRVVRMVDQQRVQATSGTHWCQDHSPRLRQGPTDADYERLPHEAITPHWFSSLIRPVLLRHLSSDSG